MQCTPRIAVIIPAYGPLTTLPRCLAAIAVQRGAPLFSVTVVDDGNTMSLAATVFPTDFPVPHAVIRQSHGGAPAARNTGARATRSEFLLFCDADVVLAPRALASLTTTLHERPEASYAYSAFRFGGKRFRCLPFDADRLRRMPYIHTTSLIRREHFPGFDETLSRFQDWDLWWTMLDQERAGVGIPEELFRIVHTRGTMSRWMPSFAYRFPWLSARIRAYEVARERLVGKHRALTRPRI